MITKDLYLDENIIGALYLFQNTEYVKRYRRALLKVIENIITGEDLTIDEEPEIVRTFMELRRDLTCLLPPKEERKMKDDDEIDD